LPNIERTEIESKSQHSISACVAISLMQIYIYITNTTLKLYFEQIESTLNFIMIAKYLSNKSQSNQNFLSH